MSLPLVVPPEVTATVAEFPYPLVFATVSGAHLYGFASPDSDWDIRGTHVLPLRQVLSLDAATDETCESLGPDGGVELDVVSHDIAKFARMLRKPNGYVIEQVLSPLVLHTTPAHERLIDLARRSVTSTHAEHYLGFARSRWKRIDTTPTPKIKPLLYAYRVLLTGIHLMRTGEIVCDLPSLAADRDWPDLDALIHRKQTEAEHALLDPATLPAHRARHDALTRELEDARASSPLPARVDLTAELDDWVYALRVG